MRRGRFVTTLGCLSLLACSDGTSAAARTAASEWSCSELRVQVDALEDDCLRARGCGKTQVYECAEGRCAREGWSASYAKERASREFQCLPDRIKVHWIQSETYRVEACGHEMTYDCEDQECRPEGSHASSTFVAIPVIVR